MDLELVRKLSKKLHDLIEQKQSEGYIGTWKYIALCNVIMDEIGLSGFKNDAGFMFDQQPIRIGEKEIKSARTLLDVAKMFLNLT